MGKVLRVALEGMRGILNELAGVIPQRTGPLLGGKDGACDGSGKGAASAFPQGVAAGRWSV